MKYFQYVILDAAVLVRTTVRCLHTHLLHDTQTPAPRGTAYPNGDIGRHKKVPARFGGTYSSMYSTPPYLVVELALRSTPRL